MGSQKQKLPQLRAWLQHSWRSPTPQAGCRSRFTLTPSLSPHLYPKTCLVCSLISGLAANNTRTTTFPHQLKTQPVPLASHGELPGPRGHISIIVRDACYAWARHTGEVRKHCHLLQNPLKNDPWVTRAYISNSSARLFHPEANNLQIQSVSSRHGS